MGMHFLSSHLFVLDATSSLYVYILWVYFVLAHQPEVIIQQFFCECVCVCFFSKFHAIMEKNAMCTNRRKTPSTMHATIWFRILTVLYTPYDVILKRFGNVFLVSTRLAYARLRRVSRSCGGLVLFGALFENVGFDVSLITHCFFLFFYFLFKDFFWRVPDLTLLVFLVQD